MATPRKRPSSGFASQEDTTPEERHEQEELTTPETPLAVVVETPFIEEEIVPTADDGPRFTPEPEKPAAAVALPESGSPLTIGKVPPKRHPRNIPKFSRNK